MKLRQSVRLLFLLILIPVVICGQVNRAPLKLNLNLELINPSTKNFQGLIKWGQGYSIVPDSTEKYSRKYSMRIEAAPNAAENGFGCGVFVIPANCEGKVIELLGYMKTTVGDEEKACLFMRIDGQNGMNQIANQIESNTSQEWKLFSIKLPLAENDKAIYFGAMFTGKGKLWIDDFQLRIDGKNISEAKPKGMSKYKALQDTTFDKGSNISLKNLSAKKINDLTLLGKLWGFLKYYHPVIAEGNINWDYELFRVMPKVLNNKNKKDRNNILLKWISALGPINGKMENPALDKKTVKLMPDLKWTEDTGELGKELTLQLVQIKNAKRNPSGFYLNFFEGVGNPKFENESRLPATTYPDSGFRILALFRYWNIINYLFPYKNLIEVDWNKMLPEYLPRLFNAKDALEYRLTFLEIISKIKDTHANIWGSDMELEKYKGNFQVPCKISFIENKAVVTGIYEGFGSTLPLKIGDVIEKINNESVGDIIKRKLAVYPASNYPTKLRDIARNLLRSGIESVQLTYSRPDLVKTEDFKCVSLDKLYKTDSAKKIKSWKMLDNNIGYIYPGTIKNSELPEIMKAFEKTDGIIIDMRCYPSEFIVFSLGAYLMPQPVDFVKFTGTNTTAPGVFSFSPPIKVGRNNPEYYKGKVIIIVNEVSQSQAEYTTLAFRRAPKAIVIGSTTAGADGNVSQFYLPGGITTMISGIGVYYPDGTETQGIGIVPDIEVKPTIKGIREGRDEPLEKAINLIQNK